MNRKFTLWLSVAALLIITAEVYLPLITQEFANWDDPKHIQAVWEPSWVKAKAIALDFNLHYTGVAYYSPLHFLSLMADQAIFFPEPGPQPWIAKAFNVLYHAVNCVLVYFALGTLGFTFRACLLGALVFSVHPLQVGTVAWVSERKNLLCAMFYLGAFLFQQRYLVQERVSSLFGMGLCFFGGLLSKPQAVTFPVTATTWLFMSGKGGPQTRRVMVGVIAGLGVVAVMWGVYVVSTEISQPGMLPPPAYRPLLAAGALMFYVSKVLLPIHLAVLYPRWDVVESAPIFVFLFLFTAILGILLWFFRRRIDPRALFGAAFFFINAAPTLGFISFGHMNHSFVADHFVYLSMFGFSIIAASVCDWALERSKTHIFRRVITPILCYSYVAALGIPAILQTTLWKDPQTLWEATLKVNQTSPTAYANYGATLLTKGESQAALDALLKAADLAPGMDIIYSNLANAYKQLGKDEEALKMLENALGRNPGDPRHYINLAAALSAAGEKTKALDLLQIGAQELVDSAPLHNELGLTYTQDGRVDDAIGEFRKALAADPRLPDAYANLGAILVAQERPKEAAEVLHKGLEMMPDSRIYAALGSTEEQLGHIPEAHAAWRRAFLVRPDLPGLAQEYGQSLLKHGDPVEAQAICVVGRMVGRPCSPEVEESIAQATQALK